MLSSSDYQRGYPYKIKKYFKNRGSVKSITKIDNNSLRHGEKLSWWDKAHRIPKSISIYYHGELVRCTKWYVNGNQKYFFNSNKNSRYETGYYSNMSIKFTKHYKLVNNKWVKDGLWEGFYKNGNKQYSEWYHNNVLDGQATYYYYNGNIKAIKRYNNGIIDDSKCYGLYSFLRENGESSDDADNSDSSSSSSNFWDSVKNDNVESEENNDVDEYIETERIFEEIEEEEENDDSELQRMLLESYYNLKTI